MNKINRPPEGAEAQDLDAPVRRALAYLGPAPANWVLPRAGIDHDVAIIGGGQNGVAAAFELRRLGITNVTVIEAAEEGSQGGWRHPARMRGLRTPKLAPGPEFGIAELSFRYWFEARFGAAAFDALPTIRRTDWADYLDWYRRIVGVPVRFSTRVVRIEPFGEFLKLHLEVGGKPKVETARKVLWVGGISSFGGAFTPAFIAENLPKAAWSHTSEHIDFNAFSGKRVAVLGAAASAFDAAAVALEHGATHVDLFCRRDQITNVANFRGRSYPGALFNYPSIPDRDRWRYNVIHRRLGSSPPRDAILRVSDKDNFRIHFNAEWSNLRHDNGAVRFNSNGRDFELDHVIAATGYSFDPNDAAVFKDIAGHIALWRDRYKPEPEWADERVGAYPYLGSAYQLTEKTEGAAPYLKNIHVFTASGTVSFGRPVSDIPSIYRGIPIIANGILRDLFFEDYEAHLAGTLREPTPEFDAALYAKVVAHEAETA
ncbi:MAG TPA: NAD(P)/FAD-dependent oxidoreductase [Pseudolabrys sp.]|nr:NAD(P)/FAD-dependent oxidoreductase [Pseudolabrys sp.]